MANETIKDVLVRLAKAESTTEKDGAVMQFLLRQVGFPKAVVVLGIVYVEGHGTVDFPPTSIHSIAGILLNLGH